MVTWSMTKKISQGSRFFFRIYATKSDETDNSKIYVRSHV